MKEGCLAPLCDGWLELENDPGLFALLLHDLGVPSVDVKEVFDFDTPIDEKAYGYVFLYNCHKSSESPKPSGRKKGKVIRSKDKLRSLFFAEQMTTNACATHSLLNIILNLEPESIALGEELEKFKTFTSGMSPEDKGYAMKNSPFLTFTHNKHAGAPLKKCKLFALYDKANEAAKLAAKGRKKGGKSKSPSVESVDSEIFHFVSYVMVKNNLMEMNSLNKSPVDYGTIPKGSSFEKYCQSIIKEKVDALMTQLDENSDMQFSLLALVPSAAVSLNEKIANLLEKQDKLVASTNSRYEEELLELNGPIFQPYRSSSQVLEEELSQVTASTHNEHPGPRKMAKLEPLKESNGNIKSGNEIADSELLENMRKEVEETIREKRKLETEWSETVLRDSQRRRHDYDPFIRRFLEIAFDIGHIDQIKSPTAKASPRKIS